MCVCSEQHGEADQVMSKSIATVSASPYITLVRNKTDLL